MATIQQRPIPAQTIPLCPTPASGWKALDTLPDGPLDLIGDIHGEIDALAALLAHLGYQRDGSHREGRRMVFLGDLIDRGPDSPGVVRWVADLVEKGRAVTVMGNHDLDVVSGRRKDANAWFFGHDSVCPTEKMATTEREREEVVAFLRAQPLARERADLRVVHACWQDESLRTLQGAIGPAHALKEHQTRIKSRLAAKPDRDLEADELVLQNENPMKLITGGPEVRAPEPFFAGGKIRNEARHPWWDEYHTGPVVVFGHYWRIPLPSLQKDDGLFSRQPLNTMLGKGKAICVDYSVGGRAVERREGRTSGPFTCRLAALRWPEQELVFDDGERQPVVMPASIA